MEASVAPAMADQTQTVTQEQTQAQAQAQVQAQVQAHVQSPVQSPPPPDNAETREAMEYWGYLFKPDKCGTEKLNRLLFGIAQCIVRVETAHIQHRPPC